MDGDIRNIWVVSSCKGVCVVGCRADVVVGINVCVYFTVSHSSV